MHILLAAALFLFTTNLHADEPDLKSIRKQLILAIDNSKTTDSLYTSLTSVHKPAGIISGYIGALLSLKAKHTWNPYFKIKYLNRSEIVFQKAVTEDPHNIEIRFMRFSIQHSVPAFLGYNKDLTTDSEDIITQINKKNYGTADKGLTVTIIKYLIESKRCTPAQTENLNNQLAQLK